MPINSLGRRSCVGDLLTILVLAIMRFVAINLPSGVEEVIAIGILLGFVRVTVANHPCPPEKHFLAADFSESQRRPGGVQRIGWRPSRLANQLTGIFVKGDPARRKRQGYSCGTNPLRSRLRKNLVPQDKGEDS